MKEEEERRSRRRRRRRRRMRRQHQCWSFASPLSFILSGIAWTFEAPKSLCWPATKDVTLMPCCGSLPPSLSLSLSDTHMTVYEASGIKKTYIKRCT